MDYESSSSLRPARSALVPPSASQASEHNSTTALLHHAQPPVIVTKSSRSRVSYAIDESGSFSIIRVPSSSSVEDTQSITSEDTIQSSLRAHAGSVPSQCATDRRETSDSHELVLSDHTIETYGARDTDFAFSFAGGQFSGGLEDFLGVKVLDDLIYGDTVQLDTVKSSRSAPNFKDPLGYVGTFPEEQSAPEMAPWTARSFSVIHTEPSVSVINQKHSQYNVTLESAPSLTADLSSRDEEQSMPCLDVASNDIPVRPIEQQWQPSKLLLQVTNDPKTPGSDVGLSRESNDLGPSSSGGYGLNRQFNYSKSGSINDESSTDVDSEDLEFWMSDYSEGTPQLDDEHPLLHLHLKAAVDHLLSTFHPRYQECAPGSRQSDIDAARSESAANSIANHRDDGQRGQKRGGCFGEEQQGTKDDLKGVQNKRRTPKPEKKRRLLLACPFSKKDPLRHRVCYRQTLTKISYVKQHLSRNHRTPIYCPVCMGVFENEEDRDVHTRARSCEEHPVAHWEGVSEAQKEKLRRKVPAKMSEEEQWFTIWGIIFPGLPRPQSPYVDSELSEELSAFRDFALGQGATVLLDHLRTAGYALDSRDQGLELAAFLETAIPDGLQIIFERFAEARQTESQRGAASDLPETSQARTDSQDGRSSPETLVEDQIAIGPSPAARTNPMAPRSAQNLEDAGGGHVSEQFDQNFAADSTNSFADFLEDLPQDELSYAPTSLPMPESENSELFGDKLYQSFLEHGVYAPVS
jgi:hypothetical protein